MTLNSQLQVPFTPDDTRGSEASGHSPNVDDMLMTRPGSIFDEPFARRSVRLCDAAISIHKEIEAKKANALTQQSLITP